MTSGLVYYWPVKNGEMADIVGYLATTSSGTPAFTADRFGNANDAIIVNSTENYWSLPSGVYFNAEYTLTAWVKNFECTHFNAIGTYK